VNKAEIGADGRKVKCSECGYGWFQEGIEDFEPSSYNEKSAIKSHTKIVAKEEVKLPFYRKAWLLFLFRSTSLLALILVLFMLAVTYRDRIIEYFPEAAYAFEAMQLHDTSGLKFTSLNCELRADEGDTQRSETIGINVKAVVKNTEAKPKYLEAMRFSLYNKEKELLGEYTIHLNKTIAAGEEEVVEGRLDRVSKTATFLMVDMGNWLDIFFKERGIILNYPQSHEIIVKTEESPTETIL
jgi:hypothetical protein